ncbi:MAG: CvfB family protein [Akkermansiaceae bacterium]
MANIGELVELTVLKDTTPGYYLDSEGSLGEVLLPRPEVIGSITIGEKVEVFIYTDSEDRPVATMHKPLVMPGQFACLDCIATTAVGSFMDWGLAKDLFVPFREQRMTMDVGKSYVVFAYVDDASDRIVASRRLNRHISKETPDYEAGQEVDLMVYAKTDLGYKAIIDGKHSGVLFASDIFRKLAPGEKMKGYIRLVRPDGKIDLSPDKPGRSRIDTLEVRIEKELLAKGGFWELCDSSPAESIYDELGVSKKAFKQATGALFRKRKITIGKDGIRAVE